LVWDSLISEATSGERAQIVVAALRATMEATVVPQDPLPTTPTRGRLSCTATAVTFPQSRVLSLK
jgi:hypothetical protein